MSVVKIEVITYDQERLNYFTDLMKKAQKKYDRLYKKFANSPYLWEETELLNDAGRELQFYKDVIALFEQGYRKHSEWISVDERLPDENVRVLVYINSERSYTKIDTDRLKESKWVRWYKDVTHWMPLPEAPKN